MGYGSILRSGAAMLFAFGVAACGGGGGGGGNVRPDSGGAAPGGATGTPVVSVVTDGAGVTVAVLDSGVRASHNEFGNGTRVLNGYNVADGNTDVSDMDSNGHGTRVAALALGTTVGVAPAATLLPVRIIGSDGTFTTSEIAAGIDYARSRGAPINNISATVYDTTSIRNALERAAAADVLTVAAAGNNGDPNPIPAAVLGNISAAAVAHFLVVGAVDADDTIAYWSDRAGTAMNRYLVARGTSVRSALNTGDDQYGRASGTSFSSPQVAGAAALVKGADPSLSMADVADILLRTADDLGAPGVDPVYGWGKLNPVRALEPVGVLAIPDTDSAAGAAAPVSTTSLRLGSAFGDALQRAPLLAGVVALDDYRRPYRVDLSPAVTHEAGSAHLAERVAAAGHDRGDLAMDLAGVRVQGSWRYEAAPAAAAFAGDDEQTRVFDQALAASGEVSGLTWEYTAGIAPDSRFGAGALAPLQRLPWLAGDHSGSGYLALLDSRARGAALGAGLSRDTAWRVGYFQGENSRAPEHLPVQATVAELDYRLRSLQLRVTAAHLREQGGVLGSYGGGALRTGQDAATTSLGLAGVWRLNGRDALIARYQAGRTGVQTVDGGLLRDWSTLGSDSWGIGAVRTDVLRRGDYLGVSYSQPLRIRSGSVTVDAPLERDLQHRIRRARAQLSLRPSGAERDWEVAYGFALGTAGEFTASLLYRTEPGHVQDADPDLAALFGFRRRF